MTSGCPLLRPQVIPDQRIRGMAKKGKSKAKTSKPSIDDLIDELSDDEEDEVEDQDIVVFKETELSKFLKQKHQGKKPVKGSIPIIKYHEFVGVTNGESLWK